MTRKNLIRTGLAIAAAMVVMTGCGNNNTAETTAAETTAAETKSAEELTDEASIELGEYKGLTITAKKEEVSDEAVEERMSYLVEAYPPTVTDRAAEFGDIANIDYEGFQGDTAFQGGTAYGYDLELGSDTFIDGFEDGIVGMMPGEERDLNLKFPDEYQNEALAGQEVVFHVVLNEIKDVGASKLDDALAKRVLEDETATLETLRASVRDDLEISAEVSFYLAAGTELLDQAVANARITCDPDAVQAAYDEMADYYGDMATFYGMELDEFMSAMYSMTLDDLKTYAETSVKQEMVINEIIRLENLEATDEQRELLARMNRLENADALIAAYGEDEAERLFKMCAGNYYLIDNAVRAEE